MLKTRTVIQEYHICDKCGQEMTSFVITAGGLELCDVCIKLWDNFYRRRENEFLSANTNIVNDFLNSINQ
jgi:hypothetical protein